MDAIYARQSVDKADSLSIQGQIDLCRRETSGECLVYQDRGYSGKNTNRPGFQRMMADVALGKISRIVVYRLDRFSRSIADFGRLWETLRRHGVEFLSIHETFDTSTPMGRAMLSIVMVFAQLERETTAQRVRDNYYQRLALGAWPGGPAPYGFSIGRLPGAGGKPIPTLIPNGQAPTVERIFAAYAQPGATLGSVARLLNSEGVPAPRRSVWDSVALSRLLHSPLYVMADEDIYLYYQGKGLVLSQGPEAFDGFHAGMIAGRRDRGGGAGPEPQAQHFSLANHGGLVPSSLWLSCQHKLDANRQLGGGGRGKHTFLSGLLKCGSCGYSVKVNRDGEKYYLLCSGRSNLGVCGQSIRVDLRCLEAAVAAELEPLLAQCPQAARQGPEDSAAKRGLAAIDRKIDRLMQALAQSSAVTMPYINRTIAALEEERRALLARQAQGAARRPSGRRIVFSALSFQQKKLAAATFIREIRLSGERAEVFWAI